MNDLLDILIDLLAEFALPEPEVNFTIKTSSGSVPVILAWPNNMVAIRQGHTPDASPVGTWTVWECHDEVSGRFALRAVAGCLQVEPIVLRLDFSRVKGLLDAGQYDAAKEALEQLESQIQQDHPDWATCGRYRKEIRIAVRKSRPASPQEQPFQPKPSFPAQIHMDAERVIPPLKHNFNIMGFFSPEDEMLSSVDAVWLAQVREGKTTAWTVCLEGNPSYEADPNWDPIGTEVEMLDELLARLEGKATFVWRAERIFSLLQNWHYRVKGLPLSGILLLDLELIAQVAFPTAHRTDLPESLCKQLRENYCDEMGLGGPLAAMLVLIQKTAIRLGGLPDVQRTALRAVLSYKPPKEKGQSKSSDGLLVGEWNIALPLEWLDFFLPMTSDEGLDDYFNLLRDHFKKMPPLVKKSDGKRDYSSCMAMDFLKEYGFLSQVASFEYRERAGQIGFSQRVEECLTDERAYVLEAGTGIGKTIGYLVPSLISGKRTFVSTHTKSLQDQAWSKDVPLVLKAFSLAKIERTVAIIKGKGNYVCLQTVADILQTAEEFVEKAEDCFFMAALVNWLLETQTGWLSEIEHLGNRRMFNHLGRDVAPPKLRDEWADIDPYARAKDAASKADLVLTNHSYVFALANAGDTAKNDVETLILDEAHNVDTVVTEVLTLHFRPWTLLHELQSVMKRDEKGKVLGLYRTLLEHPQAKENESIKRFAKCLEQYEQLLTAWCDDARKRLNDMFPRMEDFDPDYPKSFDLSDFWIKSLYDSAKNLREAMASMAGATYDLLENIESIKGLPKRVSGSLGSLEEHLTENIESLDDLFEAKPDWVHWGEAYARTDANGIPVKDGNLVSWTVELYSTPLDVAGWLKEHVNTLYKHRAYISATLTVGGSFDPICQRLGIFTDDDHQKHITGIYPSPFDYRKQALLGVPHDIPVADPALKIDPLYMEEQSKHIASEAIISEGRMLVLFTSNLIMREMASRLQARLRDHGILVLMQSDASRAALVDRLREAPRKGEKIVLLGVRSFWEGIDIPGEALSILLVSRLPFEYHNHPVARAKRIFYESKGDDRDYFRECVIPTVFLHLRQMYGRLIRSENDYGATVITDPRIYIRHYGRALLQSLPETTTVVDKSPVVIEAVQKFLRGEKVNSSYVWGSLPMVSYELSPEQRAIIECPSKRILVRAAAGSGKTHVLITRLIRFVESGQSKPEEILALTFTNKAMDVMYDRIETTLGGAKAFPMHRNVLTYHKLAMRIIRQENKEKGTEIGFINEKNPELQQELFSLARQSAGLTKEALNDEDALTMIGYAQNGLVNEIELEDAIPSLKSTQPLMAKFARFFLAYVNLLRERGVIDYGEAIVGAVRILRENKEQAQRWTNRFKWIFCDEYQDTSPAQATLLQLLGQQANLFVVGDSNQSIYSWQGSDPDNLRRFELDFPNTATFNLSKNYRCFPKLVRMSARFLERAGETGGIRVEYDEKRSTEEQTVYFLHNEDDRVEAASLTQLVKTALALELPGDPPKKATVGILARKWHLLEAIEIELIKEGIPYEFEGETARGIVASQRVRELVRRGADLLSRQMAGQIFGDSAEGRIGQALCKGHFKTADTFLRAVRNSLPSEDLSKDDASDFNRLCNILKDHQPSSVSHLFGNSEHESHVVLSTVHSQKGEEFDTVIVVGLEQGNSPHEHPKAYEHLLEWRKIVQTLSHATWREPITSEDLQRLYEQEERRIYYVAMTRARYNLVVSRAKRRYLFGKPKPYEKSMFLDLSNDPKLVAEATSSYDVKISPPPISRADDGYRSDGRVFQTISGTLVRSKSEMLLANEFTRRGMYFEYEEPSDNVLNALPDFTFTDYGNIVLEHLGLLTDPSYLERWETKAKEYEKKGIKYFRTNEEEIKALSGTVERLQDQFKAWVREKLGEERVKMIESVELFRKESGLKIGRAIGEFQNGVFEINIDGVDSIVAIALTNKGNLGEVLSSHGYRDITCEEKTINDRPVWLVRSAK